MDTNSPRGRRGVPKQLWFWVLIAIAAGTAFGLVAPDQAKDAKWLADAFVQLVKTITAPVIFLTVVVGIASLGSLTRAGGLAARALGYFLAATVVALALGLLAGNVFKPGAGFEGSPSQDAAGQAKESIAEAGEAGSGVVGFITDDLLPTSFVQPFADNEILKVLVLAILVAAAISGLAPAVRERVVGGFETASKIVFGVIRIIMWAAPLGAFGGMAFTVAEFGGGALKNLGMLLLTFWGTAAVFVFGVLGLVARLNGFSILKFIRLIKDELLITRRHVVLRDGAAAPARQARARRRVASERGRRAADRGLVQPRRHLHLPDAGRAVHRAGIRPDMALGEQLALSALMVLTSKGAAGITGAGLVTLTASLQAFGGTFFSPSRSPSASRSSSASTG